MHWSAVKCPTQNLIKENDYRIKISGNASLLGNFQGMCRSARPKFKCATFTCGEIIQRGERGVRGQNSRRINFFPFIDFSKLVSAGEGDFRNFTYQYRPNHNLRFTDEFSKKLGVSLLATPPPSGFHAKYVTLGRSVYTRKFDLR